MDEQLLIDGCMRGESWARKELYEQYAPAMMSVCMRYVGDRETARDLLQDGFVKIFTKIRSYSGSGAFGGWIRRIFVTTALEYLRSSENTRLSVGLDGYDDSLEDINYSVLDRLSADDLLACVAQLPPGYRTVFNLSEMLHVQEATSRSQFIRARNALQKSVQSLIRHENAGR